MDEVECLEFQTDHNLNNPFLVRLSGLKVFSDLKTWSSNPGLEKFEDFSNSGIAEVEIEHSSAAVRISGLLLTTHKRLDCI